MNKLNKYIDGSYTQAEFDAISEQLITQKLDRDKRKAWELKLQKQYNISREDMPPPALFNRRRWFMMASIAASMMLFIAFYFTQIASKSPAYLQAVEQHIDQLSIMGDQSILRKGQQDVSVIRKEATLAYVNKQYIEGARLWERIAASEQASGQDYFYLGLCHLQKAVSEPQKAIRWLEQAKVYEGLEQEIAWTLSLAYLKSGEIEAAQAILKDIVASKAYQHIEAAKLLNLLDLSPTHE